MVLKKNQPGYSEAKDKNGKTYWKKTSNENMNSTMDNSTIHDSSSDFDTSDNEEKLEFEPSSSQVIPKYEKMLDSKFKFRRGIAYDTGYGLERAVQEEDPSLRAKAAKFNYAMDHLSEDESEEVRMAVIDADYNVVDFRDNDPSEKVRKYAQKKLDDNFNKEFNSFQTSLNRAMTRSTINSNRNRNRRR